jgi:hypothetical protein
MVLGLYTPFGALKENVTALRSFNLKISCLMENMYLNDEN